jgi:hypothetical protein
MSALQAGRPLPPRASANPLDGKHFTTNRTRDPPMCSITPQPSTLPRCGVDCRVRKSGEVGGLRVGHDVTECQYLRSDNAPRRDHARGVTLTTAEQLQPTLQDAIAAGSTAQYMQHATCQRPAGLTLNELLIGATKFSLLSAS